MFSPLSLLGVARALHRELHIKTLCSIQFMSKIDVLSLTGTSLMTLFQLSGNQPQVMLQSNSAVELLVLDFMTLYLLGKLHSMKSF